MYIYIYMYTYIYMYIVDVMECLIIFKADVCETHWGTHEDRDVDMIEFVIYIDD